MDVLLLTEDQVVTAPKSFTSLQLLQQNSPSYGSAGARRRRWSSGICGSPKGRRPTTPTDRREGLLLALRGMAAAQDLLSFLTEARPGHFLVPGQSLNFFTLLTQNVDCAILSLEDDSNLKLHEVLDTVKWGNTTILKQYEFPSKTITEIIGNIQRYIVKEELELRKISLDVNDFQMLLDRVRGENAPTRRDLRILNYLIDITNNHELESLHFELSFHNCLLVCPEIQENMPDREKIQKICIPDISTLFEALKSISRYSTIINGMKQLPAHHSQILKAGVVEYLLGQLLRSIRRKEHLRKQIYAAAVCGLSPEGSEESQQMLSIYQRELLRTAAKFIASRTKREATVAGYKTSFTFS